jgi:hypothetical protein
VIARHGCHRAQPAGGWHAERVALALHHEGGRDHVFELRKSALGRLSPCAPRRLERERQAQNGDRTHRFGSPAGDSGTERPAADDQRKPAELVVLQLFDNHRPGGVELTSRRRRSPARYSIRLFDEGDTDALRESRLARGDEVWRGDPSTRAVPEDECGPLVVGVRDVGSREPVRCLDVDGARSGLLLVLEHRQDVS